MEYTNSGATFDLNDIQKSLKEFYLPQFRANIKDPKKHYFMNAIEEGGYESISGKYAVYALRKGGQGGAGAIPDGANYKGPDSAGKGLQNVYMRNLQVQGAIDVKTIHAGRDAGSFEPLLDAEMQNTEEAAQNDKARQFFTKQSGLITTATGTPSANKTTNADWDGGEEAPLGIPLVNSDRLGIGMRIDIYTSGGALYANEMKIVDMDDDNHVIYVTKTVYTTTVPSAAAPIDLSSYQIYNSGAKDSEIDGVETALLDAEATYHGIDRTKNRWYKPSIKTLGASTPLNEKALRSVYDKTDKRGSGNTTHMVSTHEVVAGYEAELQVFKQYSSTDSIAPELTGGYSYLAFDNKPIIRDRDATHGVLYGIDKTKFFKPTYAQYQFDDLDGNIFKFTSNQKYNYRMYEFCNVTTDTPRSHFVIANISEDEADFA